MRVTIEFGPGLSRGLFHGPEGQRLPIPTEALPRLLDERSPLELAILPRRLPLPQRRLELTPATPLPEPLLPFQHLALDLARRLALRPENRVLLVSDTFVFTDLDAPALAPALAPELARAAGPLPGGDSLLHEAALEEAGRPGGRLISVGLEAPFSVAAFLDGRPVYCSGGWSGVEQFPSPQASAVFDPGLLFLRPLPEELAFRAPQVPPDEPWLASHLALQLGRAITALGGVDHLLAGALDPAEARRQWQTLSAPLHLEAHGLAAPATRFHSFDLHGRLAALLATPHAPTRRLP